MTSYETFSRLLTLASLPHRSGAGASPILTADLVSQEALFDFQERLAGLLAELANDAGPIAQNRLHAAFPRAFAQVKP